MRQTTRPTSGICELSAAQRNREPIFAALELFLRTADRVLEIGAGDGTHALHAARVFGSVVWQTSEAPASFPALNAALQGHASLLSPIELDVGARWPDGPFEAVYAANVAHIMGWPAVCELFAGAARVLVDGGLLCLYGPFIQSHTALGEGNRAFDAALRARDPAMGLREITALDSQARRCGLGRIADIDLPANNRLLVWRASD